MPTIDHSPVPVFWDLNDRQADGLACIVDNVDFTVSTRPNVPVGISGTLRSQVFACEQVCAPLVGYVKTAEGDQLTLDNETASA